MASLKRFAPCIRRMFSETAGSGGIIESPLRDIPAMMEALSSRWHAPPGPPDAEVRRRASDLGLHQGTGRHLRAGTEVDLKLFFTIDKKILKTGVIYLALLYLLSTLLTFSFDLNRLFILIVPLMAVGMIFTLFKEYGKNEARSGPAFYASGRWRTRPAPSLDRKSVV